jgi:hypothetical protein
LLRWFRILRTWVDIVAGPALDANPARSVNMSMLPGSIPYYKQSAHGDPLWLAHAPKEDPCSA